MKLLNYPPCYPIGLTEFITHSFRCELAAVASRMTYRLWLNHSADAFKTWLLIANRLKQQNKINRDIITVIGNSIARAYMVDDDPDAWKDTESIFEGPVWWWEEHVAHWKKVA